MAIIKIRLTRKTKKDHECYECKNKVFAGFPAYYISGKESTGFYSRYAHIDCYLAFLKDNNIRISPELVLKEEEAAV